jgi:hypothetical protein
MANFEEIRECVAKIVGSIAPSIEASRSLHWQPRDGLLIACLRTVIIRQHECLSAMVCLETEQFVHLFVPFVTDGLRRTDLGEICDLLGRRGCRGSGSILELKKRIRVSPRRKRILCRLHA